MKIIYVKSSNFRNLSGLEFHLHETINFIVGENNLGKSNFLHLLNIIFNKRAFDYEDFKDTSQPINVTIQLLLEDCEIGNFEDYADEDNNNKVTINAKQADSEADLEFFHEASNSKLNASSVRNLNFVYYDSLRNPIYEISFDKNKGAATFLNYLIKRKLKTTQLDEKDLINYDNDDFNETLGYINTYLQKLKSFRDNSIAAKYEKDITDLLQKLVVLKDEENRGISKLGYGIQFSMLITLSILEKLVFIYERKNRNFFDYEEEDEEGNPIHKQAVSLVLGLDEPEIHLHPYMQRALVRYINNIIENKDTDFLEILEDVFSIHKVSGQIIIVTHSPNILLNDYKQIIRFYKQQQNLTSISGIKVDIEDTKQLDKLFMPIKEAFFSRCVIVVEGDSELGTLSSFALKMSSDYIFDNLGITVLPIGGTKHMTKVVKLLNLWGINNVAVSDLDKVNGIENDIPSSTDSFFYTEKRDFEQEIVSIIENRQEGIAIIKSIFEENSSDLDSEFVQKTKYNQIRSKYKFNSLPDISTDLRMEDFDTWGEEQQKVFLLSLFNSERFKNLTVAFTIGELLPLHLIPNVYKKVIQQAVDLSI